MELPVATLLSSTEVAVLAGVGASTVKRWADAELLRAVRTPGGHRRFERAEVERFLRTQPGAKEREQGRRDAWVELLSDDDGYLLEAELLSARARLGGWFAVADELGGALEELGVRWADGRFTILDEHIRSARLARALSRVSDRLPVERTAPVCLLATAEGDEHTLGLSLTELCLREAGWRTVWAGLRTPVEALKDGLRDETVRMIGLSASSASKQPRKLGALLSQLLPACQAAEVTLALGGKGAWPAAPLGCHRFDTFGTFHAFAIGRFAEASAQRRGESRALSKTRVPRRAES